MSGSEPNPEIPGDGDGESTELDIPWVPAIDPRAPVPRGRMTQYVAGTLTEAKTRQLLIDPALARAGWHDAQLDREFHYRAGRVFLIGDQPQRERPQYVDYVLREKPGGVPLAVLEAKDESHSPGAGLQQAVSYAVDLGAAVAMASNGHGFVAQDLRSGAVREMDAAPTVDELLSWQDSPVLAPAPNPLLESALPGRSLRYYQERAVNIGVGASMAGRKRVLLNLATGTGKTVIAANLCWKLWRAGTHRKILFLVDRLSLLGQAYNAFGEFGDARGIVGDDAQPPLLRDVHFATYQTLYGLRGEQRLYEQYPTDYFDLVVIDECHRSGYGDWSAILERFDSALQVGLTATPKRSDNIDTYEYFGAESRDSEGRGQADYEYSLARGIEDGFLATYQVVRVVSNIDESGLRVAEEVEQGAELFVPDDADPRDIYAMEQFEREISVPDRTRVLCEHLASKIKEWGPEQKTVVFCVSSAHADEVRNQLQNLLGVPTGKTRYAVRIVSEERDAQELLAEFQDPRGRQPVLATTVDLLSTGVDIPSLRNVVFMRPIASPVAFKQIVGRGTRLDERSGKLFFRIVDYTNATRLFDSWDLPTPLDEAEELVGHAALPVQVIDRTSREPISGAGVLLARGRRAVSRARTDASGQAAMIDLPSGEFTLQVSAPGFVLARESIELDGPHPVVEIALEPASSAVERIVIKGVTVTLSSEVSLTLEDGGEQLTVQRYLDLAGRRVRELVQDRPATLTELWRDPESREVFRQSLADKRVDPDVLALVLQRPDADPVDLLAFTGWGRSLKSRADRVRRAETRVDSVLNEFDDEQARLFRALLDQYRRGGVEELDSAAVLRTPALQQLGGVAAAAKAFGGAEGVRRALEMARAEVYRNGGVA